MIIPCYNDGRYLMAAVESVMNDPVSASWEIIVVDDGSTDPETLACWPQLEAMGIQIIHQSNSGLAAARNAGIAAADADYFIPLDADNLLVPAVFAKALAMMEKRSELSLVYTDHQKFGEQEYPVITGETSLPRLLAQNHIDACCLLRRADVLALGGYDGQMPAMGHEDWELLIRLLVGGKQIGYLPDCGFHYRVKKQSMLQQISLPAEAQNRAYIFNKYAAQLPAAYWQLYENLRAEQQQHDFNRHRLQELRSFLRQNRLRSMLKILLGRDFGF